MFIRDPFKEALEAIVKVLMDGATVQASKASSSSSSSSSEAASKAS